MENKKNIHLIGNAHLDPVWLWKRMEGQTEVLQTFRSALDRIREYDDFVFTCSSAAYYDWVEKTDPKMFRDIVLAVRDGRWVPVGGMWVQADCNIPSGESFARQLLYSQLYFLEKFGKICKTGYHVDSFGHNAMLPQLLKQGGMNQYVMMRPNEKENPDIPKGVFWWESPDGTRVLTYRIPTGYGEHGRAALDKSMKLLCEIAAEKDHSMMLFYGVGNHGGGPTRGDIEYLQRYVEKSSDVQFSDPTTYFEEVMQTMVDLPVWKTELQHHASGCYSATSLVKTQNRQTENLLYAAETWDTIASQLVNRAAETERFANAWKKVCFQQFHDILCGCSIVEAYDDVRDAFGYAKTIADETKTNALLQISSNIDTWVEGVSDPVSGDARHNDGGRDFLRPVVVFNSLSVAVKTPVRVPSPSARVYDEAHEPVLFSNVRSSASNGSHQDTLFLAEVPPFGYRTYWLGETEDGGVKARSGLKAGKSFLENEFMRVEFDRKTGGISRLLDKKSGIEYCGNRQLGIPVVLRDEKTDTWAHNVFTFDDFIGPMQLESMELVEKDGVRAVLRLRFVYEKSYLSCDYILAQSASVLRVKCRALWQEKFTIVKIPFALGGSEPRFTSQIPSGFLVREPVGTEEPCQKWIDLTVTDDDGKRRGLSVVNDSRYSCDCTGTRLSLTVLRNVIFADHYSNRPPADFRYTDEGLSCFEYGVVLHEGEVSPSALTADAQAFNIRPDVILAGYHKGSMPQKASFVKIDAPNVLVTALKLSEDGSDSVVLRLYETEGKEKTRISVMSELLNCGFYSDLTANQIKTFRIDSSGRVYDVNFLEGIDRK